MDNPLKILRKYFESGTAEGDDRILQDVFVEPEEYSNFISVPSSGPRLLLGNKGSGKSAVLRYFRNQLQEAEIPVILLRPKDISLPPPSDSALGPLIRSSEYAILSALAVFIGRGIKGLVIGESEKVLLTQAQKAGESDRDFIQKALVALAVIGKAFSDIDVSSITSKNGLSQAKIRRAIEDSLNSSNKLFYVLIDDTDQLASPNEANHLNRIWAFILAARAINESCGNIKFVISIRNEVWRRLTRDTAGQRDQVDHFRNLTRRIHFSNDTLKEIIKKRLIAAHGELDLLELGSPYSSFFDTTHVRIPTTDEEYRYWDDFLVGRSRRRPRDSIQLIYKLVDHAIRTKSQKVTSGDVAAVMPEYSEERVDDLKRECDLECPQIKEIVRAFHNVEFDGGSFTLKPQSVADFINTLPSRFSITLFSRPISHGNKDDVFQLWRYLYEIGFLNARISDSREAKGYRHVSPEEDPELVSISRWNEMQAILWEVNPAYRDYLIKIQKEKEFSFGQPMKSKRRRR